MLAYYQQLECGPQDRSTVADHTTSTLLLGWKDELSWSSEKKILLGVLQTAFLSSSGNGWEVKIQMIELQKIRKAHCLFVMRSERFELCVSILPFTARLRTPYTHLLDNGVQYPQWNLQVAPFFPQRGCPYHAVCAIASLFILFGTDIHASIY